MTQQVGKLYKSVIDDVVNSVREAFADEGIDEQVLLDLKATWEKRLSESKAIAEASASQSNSITSGAGGASGPANASSSSTHVNHNNNNSITSSNSSGNSSSNGNNNSVTTTITSPPPNLISIPTNNLPGPIVNAARVTTITPMVPASLVTAANSITSTPVSTIQPPQSSASSSAPLQPQTSGNFIVQLDGPVDTDDEDEDDDDDIPNDDDHDDNDDDGGGDEDGENLGEDEEPLNSEDDVSDEEPNELFETDNVVVCQYDKITRSRNKWKFHLKDGIMNLQGRDYVFQKAVGDAEW